ncbi:hypothetical protein BT69DRAFT_467326 [Atractiella rhizophila]|nr:hypothetical protein BT69DRAFT_467326 [Atractiella rhizophila]
MAMQVVDEREGGKTPKVRAVTLEPERASGSGLTSGFGAGFGDAEGRGARRGHSMSAWTGSKSQAYVEKLMGDLGALDLKGTTAMSVGGGNQMVVQEPGVGGLKT